MNVSKEVVKLVVVTYFEKDNDSSSEMITKIFPCRNNDVAKEFEHYYKINYPNTQLCKIQIIDSNIYG